MKVKVLGFGVLGFIDSYALGFAAFCGFGCF